MTLYESTKYTTDELRVALENAKSAKLDKFAFKDIVFKVKVLESVVRDAEEMGTEMINIQLINTNVFG